MSDLQLTVERVITKDVGFRIILRGEGQDNEFGTVPGRAYNMNVGSFKEGVDAENVIGKEIAVNEDRVIISEFESTGEKTKGKMLKYYWIK